jgi:peptidylprolyl isomerase
MEKIFVTLETTQGSIKVKLFPETAPKACENFSKLAEKGYYNGIIFHRVIPGFMIQGGDPTGTGRGGESIWGRPFADEVTRSVTFNRAGLLAMANAGPSTNGSQFFITCAPTDWLNMRHTIFGEVVEGMDVLKKIETTKTSHGDRPVTNQEIIKASVLREESAT